MDINGTTTLATSQFLEILEKAKQHEESIPKTMKVFEKLLTEISMGVVRFVKASGGQDIRIRPFNPQEMVREILEEDKVVHILILSNGDVTELAISTGIKEKDA